MVLWSAGLVNSMVTSMFSKIESSYLQSSLFSRRFPSFELEFLPIVLGHGQGNV